MSAVVLNGIFVGVVYGLLGVGLVVCYRGSRVINFAYGETGMLGAFLFTELRFGDGLGLPVDHGLWPALPLGILAAAALGGLTERLVVRPLRTAPRIRPLVGTFAVASLFFTFASRRWGVTTQYSGTLIRGDGVSVAGLQVQAGQLLILGVCMVALTAIWALYRFTGFGLRLRATALDPYGAGLVGVNVDRTSLLVWALAGGLAGLTAILISPLVAFNVVFMTTLSIRGLAAALVGGLSNIGSTFVAGLLIGVAEAVISFKSPISGLTDVTVAALVLILMVARPTGLGRAAY